jgi:triacylglycerol lipase
VQDSATALAQAREKVRSFGPQLSAAIMAELQAVYAPLQAGPPEGVRIERDIAYGAHDRHRLNLFVPRGASAAGIVLYIHGGGFVTGDKEEMPGAFYDNVGLWAAGKGLIGATMNYRLAPDHPWPAGRDDVGAAIDWLRTNAAQYGGDPQRIFVIGHSAGGAHLAGFMSVPGNAEKLAGCICVSGVYDLRVTPVNTTYFGKDEALYAERSPLPGLTRASTPLLVVTAEFDPEYIQRHWLSLVAEVLREKKTLPRLAQIRGHSHFSIVLHLNSPDTSLGDQLIDFIRQY